MRRQHRKLYWLFCRECGWYGRIYEDGIKPCGKCPHCDRVNYFTAPTLKALMGRKREMEEVDRRMGYRQPEFKVYIVDDDGSEAVVFMGVEAECKEYVKRNWLPVTSKFEIRGATK